jgi:hypothetical protein
VTFVADERGRVPFALIAALLLVSSLTYTSGLVHEEPADPVAPELIADSTQEARIQLGSVARAADHAAANDPLVSVANTPLGRVLADDPFERALELRIAVRAREAIRANRSAGGVTATVSVPPIADEAAARRVLREVAITHLEGDRYRVTLENVSVTVRRDGRVVERDVVTLETTVALPSMTVHQRAQTFERRLSANPVEPGLNRGLTARLFAIAWVRGYMQYGGAPISNVVANRHVGVMTNDALVEQQVAAFGRADPDSRRGVARAAADVAVADGVSGMESAISSAMRPSDEAANPTGASSLGAIDTPSVMADDHEFDVDRRADNAFIDFVDADGIDRALNSAYRASVRPETSVRRTGIQRTDDGKRPENGTRRYSFTTSDRRVSDRDKTTGHGSTVLEYDRTVTTTETEHTYWTVNGTFAGTTSTETERTYDVSIAVQCRYDRPHEAPPGRVVSRCPFDGAERAALEDEAATAMAARFGGVDTIARRAVSADRSSSWRPIRIEPSAATRESVYESTAALRDEVRAVDVSADPASMASTANPASQMARTIDRRHERLVDAPRTYDSAAAVATFTARDRYLGTLNGDLSEQSSSFAAIQDSLGDAMASHSVPADPPVDDPDALPPIAASVSAEPRYLSLETERGSPPLAARNLNVFTVPYNDAADAVSGTIGGDDESTSFASATSTLVATDRVLESEDDPQLRSERRRLRRGIDASLATIRDEQRRALVTGTALSSREASRVVDRGYRRHETVAEQAQAVVDGSIATDIAEELPSTVSSTDRDRALVELRTTTTAVRSDESVRLHESAVASATERLRPHVEEGVEQSVRVGTHRAVTAGKKRAMRSAAAQIPAGLPLTPVPGQWYATANVWVVSVRGGYDRFTVNAPRSTPAYGSNGTVSYVRESAPVTLDVDGDGVDETLGRNEPIELSADTGVFVIVPPGKSGVGDTDGTADEQSPGW